MKKAIEGGNIPKAVGPYSAGVKSGNMIFISGQLPVDVPTGEIVKNDIPKATKTIMKNIEDILKAEGFTLNDIVKVTVFSQKMSYFAEFNEVYKTFFQLPYPARSFIAVAGLPKDADIEIEAIAMKA